MTISADISIIKLWFERAVPNPTDKNRAVQFGCHLEEVCEMADAASIDLGEEACRAANAYKSHHQVPLAGSADFPINRKELLDALCDQIVTAVGVAHMFDMDIAGALSEVNKSNWSKFDEHGQPIFNEQGKIAKGSNYTPPNLEPFV